MTYWLLLGGGIFLEQWLVMENIFWLVVGGGGWLQMVENGRIVQANPSNKLFFTSLYLFFKATVSKYSKTD